MRGLYRRHHRLSAQPCSDLVEAEGGWRAIGDNPQFQLLPIDGRYPSGWVLFDTRVIRQAADCSARLLLDLGAGFAEGQSIDIPSTRKGRVLEVLFLPPHIVGMRWAPQMAPGPLEQGPIFFIEIGTIERIVRMVRRILPVLRRRAPEQLQAAGLSVTRMLVDLRGAYRAAGNLRAYTPAPSYPQWIERFDQLSLRDRNLIAGHIADFPRHPHLVLVVTVRNDHQKRIAATLASLGRQLYRHLTVVMLDAGQTGAQALNWKALLSDLHLDVRIIETGTIASCLEEFHTFLQAQDPGDFVAVLGAGDLLPEQALYWMAGTILSSPEARLLYSDGDHVNEQGERQAPAFKPDWSLELLRSANYIGQLALFRCDALMKAGGLTAADYAGDHHDLLLRMADVLSASQVAHIPAVLCHRRADPQIESASGGVAAVEAHLTRNGIPATVSETLPGAYRISYHLPERPPMISLVIPTRDAVAWTKRCIDSVLQRSTYSNYEILLVDNQSRQKDTLDYLQELRAHPSIRVLPYDRPFNYSAINNAAARQARGEVLCLLNNDTEVLSPDWMEEMLGRLLQDRVGAVGAKLYYSDGRVQHGGDVVGVGGIANHLHAYLERDRPGYGRRAMLAQDLSAVTGACLMTWRSLYEQLGGLNKEQLPVAFNDVDYCLRLREAGYRVIWTPHAELYHHESVSRGLDDSREKRARAKGEATYMRSRWKAALGCDPFYNPNLSSERPDFSLSHAPVIRKPWLTPPDHGDGLRQGRNAVAPEKGA